MFQDKDQEELCAILYDQNDGNLDASIEHILAFETQKEENETGDKDTDKDKDDPTLSQPVDKETQELIDEMLAEDQQ